MKNIIKTIGNKITYLLCYMTDMQSGSLYVGLLVLLIILGVL